MRLAQKYFTPKGAKNLMARKCSTFIDIFQYRPTGILCNSIHLGYVGVGLGGGGGGILFLGFQDFM